MIVPLFLSQMRSCLPAVSVFVAVIGLYTASIASMFDPELGDSLAQMQEAMPELFAAFGMAQPSVTIMEFYANYLYGFLYTVMPFALTMLLANGLVVRHVERGTLASFLATPHSRPNIALTQAIALLSSLVLLLVFTTVFEVGFAELFFPGELDYGCLFRANVALICLWVFLAGVCFLSACSFKRPAAALWVGGAVCIAAFLVQMVSQVGESFEFLGSLTPLSLFDVYGVMGGSPEAMTGSAVLLTGGVLLFATAILVFSTRDFDV